MVVVQYALFTGSLAPRHAILVKDHLITDRYVVLYDNNERQLCTGYKYLN